MFRGRRHAMLLAMSHLHRICKQPFRCVLVLAGLTALGVGAWSTLAAEPATVSRKPWTTSRVVGSPEPPPAYRTVRVFPNVQVHHALLLVRAPGTDRLFVGEQDGRIWSIANRPDAKAEPFLDLVKDYKTLHPLEGAKKTESVYGLVFHPKFAENHYCYVCYTLHGKPNDVNLENGTRVSRFRVTTTDPPRAEPESEQIIISWMQGGHNGGDLHFGPDGYLYISSGDAAEPNPPDRFRVGQDLSRLMSKILRIDVDHPDGDKAYTVPKDNPFVDLKGARPETWAYGLRNPWRMSFDRKTGQLWVGDVGWELWESVHRVERGGNYGWSIVESRQPINTDMPIGPTPIRPPIIELPHTLSASVTGGYVYHGKKFPELEGAYIFGDWETKRIWAARIEGDRMVSLTDLVEPTHRVVAFGEDHDGELYVVDYDVGTIHTLERNPTTTKTADFPRTLSATGLFASVKDHVPAEGVVPFAINAPQWADGATAERWIAVPGSAPVPWLPKDVQYFGSMFTRRFDYPLNTVFARTFTLELERGNPASRKRIETQIMQFDGKQWKPYTYAWNDAGTDADLVAADGREQIFVVRDSDHPGGKREVAWSFAARSQCSVCHTPWAQAGLGFSISQLNRDVEVDGTRVNQLKLFEMMGLLKREGAEPGAPLKPTDHLKQPTLCDPFDASHDLDLRARSYLHANCGHCHRFGGGGAVDLELHAALPLDKTRLLDVAPHQGTFDLPEAKIIVPGVPDRSTLYYRMAKFGRGRMPRMGSDLPDEAGLALIKEWIQQLPTKDESHANGNTTSLTADDIDHRLATPATAMELARLVGGNKLSADMRKDVLTRAAKLTPGPVRDLFEGYFPTEGRVRKLGSNPRPAAILGLKGDADRGRTLFFANGMTCQNCHRIGDKGIALGPDLSAIGKTRTKEDLLDSILDPSRRIEPQFVSYNVETKIGRQVTGLLVKRDANEVVLRDAQNQEVRLRADDVASMTASRVSLMPDGALRDLTAQQAADLVEFLAGRK
jgi:putative heme-binding domain-containing protein